MLVGDAGGASGGDGMTGVNRGCDERSGDERSGDEQNGDEQSGDEQSESSALPNFKR